MNMLWVGDSLICIRYDIPRSIVLLLYHDAESRKFGLGLLRCGPTMGALFVSLNMWLQN